jgi:hypothetical protein
MPVKLSLRIARRRGSPRPEARAKSLAAKIIVSSLCKYVKASVQFSNVLRGDIGAISTVFHPKEEQETRHQPPERATSP